VKYQSSNQTTVNELPSINIPQADFRIYALSHWRALLVSLRRLMHTPLESITILAVIGIALALPSGLFVLLQNIQKISLAWDQQTKISLFLKTTVNDTAAMQLVDRLQLEETIAQVNYVSPQQGLERLSKQAGFTQALGQFSDNPLPGLIEVVPSKAMQAPEVLGSLVEQLQKLPEVDMAQLDMAWVKRLHSLLKLSKKGAYALAIFFASAVFLIIGNTIHLAIQNQRREIEVIKLVGGTYAFIRRPFLYRGMLYGFLGAIFAALFIGLGLLWLRDTVAELAAEYNSAYTLAGLGWSGLGLLLLSGILLGLAGAWLAVNHYLRLAD